MRHPTPQFAPSFDDFLEQLRAKGFEIGVEHHLRMRVLLERASGALLPGDLKTLLCPIVATSPEQQETFYAAFDEAFPHYRAVPEFESEVETTAAVAAPPPAIAPAPVARTVPRRWVWLSVSGFGVAVLVVGLVLMCAPSEEKGASQPAAGTPAAGAMPNEMVLPAVPTPADAAPALPEPPPPVAWRWWHVVAASIPFAVWLLVEGVIRRRREASLQRRRGLRPPLSWPVNVNNTHIADHSDPQFHGLARRMQRRQASAARELDLAATIRATIEGLGYPRMVYRTGTQAPEYLVLVERMSPQDHQAHFYSQMVRALEAEGVHIREFHFDGDPRECWKPEGGEPVSLAELYWQTGERLILIGEMDCFVDGVSGEVAAWAERILDQWPERAVLTPLPMADWGVRERVVSRVAPVFPATVSGMMAAVDSFWADSSRGRGRDGVLSAPGEAGEARVSSGLEPGVTGLRRSLSTEGFALLCACAVYPELNWNLTLRLATLPSLPGNLLTEDQLLPLVRLPWFRRGVLPDELRLALIQELPAEQQRGVRRTILDVLQGGPQAPEGTHARDYQQLEIAFNRHWLERTTETLRAFEASLRRWPDLGDINKTYVVLAESWRTSFLDFFLPATLSRKLRGIYPVYHRIPFALRGVACCLLAGVLVLGVNWTQDRLGKPGLRAGAKGAAVEPGWANVRIRTLPTGASVRLDNGMACRSDCTLQVTPGQYQLTAELEGYRAIREVISVAAGSLDMPFSFVKLEVAAPQPSGPLISRKGETREAEVLRWERPRYPEAAGRENVQGTVEMRATIREDGTVGPVDVLSGHPLLQAAAVESVRKSTYRPALRNGRPHESVKTVSVELVRTGGNLFRETVVTPITELAPPVGLPSSREVPTSTVAAATEGSSLRTAVPPPVVPSAPPAAPAVVTLEPAATARSIPAPSVLDAHAVDRQEIAALLAEYAGAWRRKDASRIASLFPAAPLRDLRAVFDFATQVEFDLAPLGAVQFAEGGNAGAQVSCRRTTRIEYRDRRTPQIVNDTVTVKLSRIRGAWRIQSIQ